VLKNLALLPALISVTVIAGVIGILMAAAAYSEAHTVTWSRSFIPAGETLRLSENGTYYAELWLDIGPNSESRGRWQESNGIITLHPEHEAGLSRRLSRTYMRRQVAGEQVLVPSEDLAAFEEEQFGSTLAFHVQAKRTAR
jgi:hypothetical protein